MRTAVRTIRRAFLAATAWALCAAAMAQADTLADAFAAAYETNPELIEARANLRAVDERVNQARAGLRPSLNSQLEYGGDVTNRPAGQRDNFNDPFRASVTASQPLYDGGRTQNATRGRIADVSAARARLTALEQRVLLDVARAYADVLRDLEFVSLAENNVRVIAEQLRASEDRFEVGEVTRTDVSQARARLAAARANLTSTTGQLERSRQNYRLVVGAEPLNLRLLPPPPDLPRSLDEAVTLALESHPEIVAARFDETSASRDVRVAIGELLPRVSLDGTVAYGDTGVFKDNSVDSTSASVTARVTIPLYQGGAEYSRIRQAQALASRARAGITTQARSRQQLAEAAWTELQVARANIRSNREGVEAAQLAFDGVREEAIVGSRTTLDVLDAEQELLDTRTQLVASVRDEFVAAYGLLSTVGRLTAADAGLAVTAYDPDVNYAENNARRIGYPDSQDTVWEQLWRP